MCEMILLLFMLVLALLIVADLVLIIILCSKTPSKQVIMWLDQVKRGRGPVVVKTISGSLLMVVVWMVYSMMMIQKRTKNPSAVKDIILDEFSMGEYLFGTSLIGFFLCLLLLIDRLHKSVKKHTESNDQGSSHSDSKKNT